MIGEGNKMKNKMIKKSKKKLIDVEQGSVYLIDFGEYRNHVKGGVRPGLVISNNHENKCASQVLVVPITSVKPKHLKKKYRNDVLISPTKENGIDAESIIHAGNIRSIDKADFFHKIGNLEEKYQRQVAAGFLYTVGLSSVF